MILNLLESDRHGGEHATKFNVENILNPALRKFKTTPKNIAIRNKLINQIKELFTDHAGGYENAKDLLEKSS